MESGRAAPDSRLVPPWARVEASTDGRRQDARIGDDPCQLTRKQRLRSIAPCLLGARVHLHGHTVGAGSDRGAGERRDEARDAGRVTGVHHHGQVAAETTGEEGFWVAPEAEEEAEAEPIGRR